MSAIGGVDERAPPARLQAVLLHQAADPVTAGGQGLVAARHRQNPAMAGTCPAQRPVFLLKARANQVK
jgi:hypothetical protein